MEVFVAMPFDAKHETVFKNGIKSAIEEMGHKCKRADDANGPRNIVKVIMSCLHKCDIVVAVLTDSNPNVFYEIGIAHTLGNKTLLLCEYGHKLPFDLASYHVVFYENSPSGIQELKNKLTKDIIEFDKWTIPNNPVQEHIPTKSINNILVDNSQYTERIAGEDIKNNSVVCLGSDNKVYMAEVFEEKGVVFGFCQNYTPKDEICCVFTKGEIEMNFCKLVPQSEYTIGDYSNNSNLQQYTINTYTRSCKRGQLINKDRIYCEPIGTSISPYKLRLNIKNGQYLKLKLAKVKINSMNRLNNRTVRERIILTDFLRGK